ncbi:enoyl-(acyl carrier) reductase (macronuclear) [Tetrahymena thermophila SB210]|uniref:Enoyl-(Acyl carrier) reductase n=1 Tax=Tetrahymena thermophila (strain SB210) TaxID=312017 RepID=Q236R7_TETTS|nr:enoyl-(acyl carrier) reductase [Tetrahymena thermophila SB210]EAR92433.1 enoyl-(acyl carrier) reductase [Tetrahymena thermophila SB210]|eukprot:XP_001012678.1 enoyl-(acyl carrier) reductase [Tetrahymena thermophila SB210]
MKIDQDLVVFITGAASGLGFQTAKDLLDRGAKCFLTDRDSIDHEFLQRYSADKVVFRNLDITNEEDIKKAVQECVKYFGHIDALLNSAGIATMQFVTDDSFNTKTITNIFNINVVGGLNTSKYVALQMVKQQKENQKSKDYLIINVSSAAANGAPSGLSIYGATKGAILAMTLPMARDLGKYGIRVVCISPGYFNTKMGKSTPKQLYDFMARMNCLGRNGEPQEFSQAVQGVMECQFLTGTHFYLDSCYASPHF